MLEQLSFRSTREAKRSKCVTSYPPKDLCLVCDPYYHKRVIILDNGDLDLMLSNYFPILVFIGFGLAIGFLPVMLGFILGPRKPNPAKNSPYECGFDAIEDARMPFDVRFYLVAILFIIFDLETAFLFPWAVVLRKIGPTAFWAMMFFLAILVVGFIYEWRKGALEWE